MTSITLFMKKVRLSRGFFGQATLTVARKLLGKFLVRRIGSQKTVTMITETEAYFGFNDSASHAWRGQTKRTEVMFGPPGHAYVYLIYGVYHCLNVVTEKDGYPAAVLIRGVKVITNHRLPLPKTRLDGPGKVCRFLLIDKSFNKEDLTVSKKLWIEDRGVKIGSSWIKRAKRIGVDYAGRNKDNLWRFVIEFP